MKIYNYHPVTKEFLSETEADKDPLEKDKYLIPAHSTTIPPEIKAEPNKTHVFRDNTWVLVDDFRGFIGWDKRTQEKTEIKDIEIIPDTENLVEVEPPKNIVSKWNGTNWEKEIPLAMGLDLINFISQTTITQLSDEQSFSLVEKLVPFFIFLQQKRCNPCSESTLATSIKLLDEKLVSGQKDLIVKLIEVWKKDKQFISTGVS